MLCQQSNWLTELLLPLRHLVICDANPGVGIEHETGHAEGLESNGFGLHSYMLLVIKRAG